MPQRERVRQLILGLEHIDIVVLVLVMGRDRPMVWAFVLVRVERAICQGMLRESRGTDKFSTVGCASKSREASGVSLDFGALGR